MYPNSIIGKGITSLVIIFILLIHVDSFAQKTRDSVVYGDLYPVKKGYIFPFNPPPGRIVCPNGIEYIYSKENDVHAIMEGKITRIFKMDSADTGEQIVIVSRDTGVVYGNLVSRNRKVGDTVRRGEFLGKIGKDNEADRYMLYFGIMVGVKMMMGQELIAFLKKYN